MDPVVVETDAVAQQQLVQTALSWPARAEAARVVDDASYLQVADWLKAIKALRTKIAAIYDKNIKRWHEGHKIAVKEKADAEAPLVQAEALFKKHLADYATAQEIRRKAEEARLAELARREEENRRLVEAAALEEEGVATGDADMVQTAQQIMAAPVVAPVVTLPKSTPTVAGLSFREVWKYRITNIDLLPKAYMVPDEARIGAVVRALKAQTDIPGIQVYSEKVPSASGR